MTNVVYLRERERLADKVSDKVVGTIVQGSNGTIRVDFSEAISFPDRVEFLSRIQRQAEAQLKVETEAFFTELNRTLTEAKPNNPAHQGPRPRLTLVKLSIAISLTLLGLGLTRVASEDSFADLRLNAFHTITDVLPNCNLG